MGEGRQCCNVNIGFREIEKGVRDGVKVLANAVSANAVTKGQRLVDQRTGLKTNAIPGTLAAVTDLVVSRKKTTIG